MACQRCLRYDHYRPLNSPIRRPNNFPNLQPAHHPTCNLSSPSPSTTPAATPLAPAPKSATAAPRNATTKRPLQGPIVPYFHHHVKCQFVVITTNQIPISFIVFKYQISFRVIIVLTILYH
ncbi:hypothetical protein BJ165DRAFT_1614822 [Panaeolus papilionaceus]|nr:hypothetical protein BJ165DRAFT_1614822 [Panaeolus papilionaceus]